jgi:hypothetical protein
MAEQHSSQTSASTRPFTGEAHGGSRPRRRLRSEARLAVPEHRQGSGGYPSFGLPAGTVNRPDGSRPPPGQDEDEDDDESDDDAEASSHGDISWK